MAAANLAKMLQGEMTCPLCLECLNDPVSLDCDHSFCRACITQCWGELATDVSCPLCRQTFPRGKLRLNRQLRNIVDATRELLLQSGREPAAERLCEKHREPLKLFCKEDEIPICLVCDRSKGHRDHTVIPAEDAAKEFQVRLQAHLKTLRAKRETLLGLKVSREKRSQEYLKQTQAERQMIVAEFQQLRQFLEEQERLLLAQLEKLDEEIGRLQTDNVGKLSEQISHLSELIGELEGKCQKPASEFLQDVRSTLSRCEIGPVQLPEEISPELGERVRGFSRQTTALSETLREFTATVTLDPDTAHPSLVLSEDRKHVSWELTRQPLPDNPERTLCSVCWAVRGSPRGDIAGRW
uniref:Uncharacterized protein n=1 Tax=Pelodiscus sinensis TaxID=13735 RepID=K7FIT0_PELSI